MHSQGVSHRDLKPENILMAEDFSLKLADMGFSSSKETNSTRVGTCAYMSPEIHMGVEYSGAAADLFACATILYIMLVGRPCFHTAKASDPYYKYMAAGKCDKFWSKHTKTFTNGPETYSAEFMDLINKMLQYNPEDRLSIEEVMAHPWYTGPIPSTAEIQEEFAQRWALLN